MGIIQVAESTLYKSGNNTKQTTMPPILYRIFKAPENYVRCKWDKWRLYYLVKPTLDTGTGTYSLSKNAGRESLRHITIPKSVLSKNKKATHVYWYIHSDGTYWDILVKLGNAPKRRD